MKKKVKNYEEFVKILKTFDSKEKKFNFLWEYFLKQVKYNYELLPFAKFYKYNDNDISLFNYIYILEYNFNQNKEKDPKEKLKKIVNKNVYEKIFEKYGKEITEEEKQICKIPDFKGKKSLYQSLFLCCHEINKPQFENGLIKKGVCLDFSNFAKKVMQDLGEQIIIVRGTTPNSHIWYAYEENGNLIHFDPTYAMFVRDNFFEWDKGEKENILIKDFFATSFENLQKLNPKRTIEKTEKFFEEKDFEK